MSIGPLQRYCDFFAGISPESLDGLADVMSADVHFRDPFNDVRGLKAVRRVFEHMFGVCAEARFEILDAVHGGDRAYIQWRFHFRLRSESNPREPIEGVSRVVFDSTGRVEEHIDFWDPASGLYESVPLLGSLLRWLRRRLAAGSG